MTEPTEDAIPPTPDRATPDRATPDRATPDRRPGDRRPAGLPRLAVPPSQRYVQTARGEVSPDDEPSFERGLVLAVLVAAFCGLILVVLGGAFDFTAGLIVVAFFVGRLTAIAMRIGAGSSVSEARRLGSAVLISLVAIVLAQAALWIWALAEGGALGPLDFLAQTYGVLVLLELLLAGGAAWLAS